MRQVQALLAAGILLLLFHTPVRAQVTTSTLVGLVRDTSQAVIPGATVVATHEGTGVSREGVTDANGEFVFSALPSGPYSVRIELTGFKTLQNRGMHRRRFLIRANRGVDVSAFLAAWASRVKLHSAVRVQIDVDPYSFL